MRVAYFIYDHPENPWQGGASAIRAREICRRMAKADYKITIISGRFPAIMDYEENNIKYLFIGDRSSHVESLFTYQEKASLYLDNNYRKYEIIIEDFSLNNRLGSHEYQYVSTVVLQQHHLEGKNILKKSPFMGIPYYFTEKRYHKKFNNFVSSSEETLKALKRKDGLLIQNGIDERLLNTKTGNKGYLLYFGDIDFQNKGIDMLLQAGFNKPLIIAGKGKDSEKLRSMVKDNPKIKYIKPADDNEKYSLIANSSIVLLPSPAEGHEMSALEAAALGKPVIVSNIPELHYVVKNKFGMSFKSGDKKELKDAVDVILNFNPQEMSDRGRKFAANRTWGLAAAKFHKLLQDLTKK